MSLLRSHSLVPSMSRPANPYDNASCESFMRTLKREEIRANEYRDLGHLLQNVAAFIDHYYNRVRLHSALGYRPPEEFEQLECGSAEVRGASFLGMRRSIDPMKPGRAKRRRLAGPPPRTIVPMSLRLAIPRQVALQQSPLPLRQPQPV